MMEPAEDRVAAHPTGLRDELRGGRPSGESRASERCGRFAL